MNLRLGTRIFILSTTGFLRCDSEEVEMGSLQDPAHHHRVGRFETPLARMG